MKKLTALMTVALIAIASLALTSCEDDNDHPYYFDLDEALNGYFDRYGDFGTDQRTTADWFDYYYPYASDYDYRDFINAVSSEIYKSRSTMARYLNGEWEGPLTMYYKDTNGQTAQANYQVTWHFELSTSSDTQGRGTEWRTNDDEGTTVTNFSWSVNDTGGIEISYDPSTPNGTPVNMLIAYSNLDRLSTTEFQGTSVGQNIDEEDDFSLRKRLPQQVAGQGVAKSGKTFGGAKGQVNLTPIERHITISNGHR